MIKSLHVENNFFCIFLSCLQQIRYLSVVKDSLLFHNLVLEISLNNLSNICNYDNLNRYCCLDRNLQWS